MIKNWDAIKAALISGDSLEIPIEFEPYEQIILRPDYLLELFDKKNVIHLGCTDSVESIKIALDAGQEMHALFSFACEKYVGIDTNKEVPLYLNSKGIKNVYFCDTAKTIHEKFDYMFIENILERAENPVQYLKEIFARYGESVKEFVINVSNVLGLSCMNNVISFGKETAYSEKSQAFTPYTIIKTVCAAGFDISDIQMCINENSSGIFAANERILKERPILMDSICIICSKI